MLLPACETNIQTYFHQNQDRGGIIPTDQVQCVRGEGEATFQTKPSRKESPVWIKDHTLAATKSTAHTHAEGRKKVCVCVCLRKGGERVGMRVSWWHETDQRGGEVSQAEKERDGARETRGSHNYSLHPPSWAMCDFECVCIDVRGCA